MPMGPVGFFLRSEAPISCLRFTDWTSSDQNYRYVVNVLGFGLIQANSSECRGLCVFSKTQFKKIEQMVKKETIQRLGGKLSILFLEIDQFVA